MHVDFCPTLPQPICFLYSAHMLPVFCPFASCILPIYFLYPALALWLCLWKVPRAEFPCLLCCRSPISPSPPPYSAQPIYAAAAVFCHCRESLVLTFLALCVAGRQFPIPHPPRALSPRCSRTVPGRSWGPHSRTQGRAHSNWQGHGCTAHWSTPCTHAARGRPGWKTRRRWPVMHVCQQPANLSINEAGSATYIDRQHVYVMVPSPTHSHKGHRPYSPRSAIELTGMLLVSLLANLVAHTSQISSGCLYLSLHCVYTRLPEVYPWLCQSRGAQNVALLYFFLAKKGAHVWGAFMGSQTLSLIAPRSLPGSSRCQGPSLRQRQQQALGHLPLL